MAHGRSPPWAAAGCPRTGCACPGQLLTRASRSIPRPLCDCRLFLAFAAHLAPVWLLRAALGPGQEPPPAPLNPSVASRSRAPRTWALLHLRGVPASRCEGAQHRNAQVPACHSCSGALYGWPLPSLCPLPLQCASLLCPRHSATHLSACGALLQLLIRTPSRFKRAMHRHANARRTISRVT